MTAAGARLAHLLAKPSMQVNLCPHFDPRSLAKSAHKPCVLAMLPLNLSFCSFIHTSFCWASAAALSWGASFPYCQG